MTEPKSRGGRPRGTKNRTSRAFAEFEKRVHGDRGKGRLPLDVMLMAMDEALIEFELLRPIEAQKPAARAALDKAAGWAKECAPYLHPRLQATHSSAGQRTTHEDWLRMMRAEALGVVEAADDGPDSGGAGDPAAAA